MEKGLSYGVKKLVYGQILSDSPWTGGQTSEKDRQGLMRDFGDIVAKRVGSFLEEDDLEQLALGSYRTSPDISYSNLPLGDPDIKGSLRARFGVNFPVETEGKPNEFTSIYGDFDFGKVIPVGKAEENFRTFLNFAEGFVKGVCEDYCSVRGCDVIMPFYFKTLGLSVPEGSNIGLLFAQERGSIEDKFQEALRSDTDLKSVMEDFKKVHKMPFGESSGEENIRLITTTNTGHSCLYCENIGYGEIRPFLNRTNVLKYRNNLLSSDDEDVISHLIYMPVQELVESREFKHGEFDFKGINKILPFAAKV